jgi:molybdopterin molybdotransferase
MCYERRVIPVGEALAHVVEATPVLGAERTLLSAALGRVAAESVVSPRAVPAAPNSAMDGYAVRHADLATVPVGLRIVAIEPAGTVVGAALEPGAAVKLFTGSVIPAGADTVVRVEDTDESEGTVVVRAAPALGANIRAAGEDIRPGRVVVEAGSVVGAADVGVLASVGRATVLVRQRPRVAIVSTGSELVELDETPGAGQVVNSNAYALAAAVHEAGGAPVVLPVVRDRPEEIRSALAQALRTDVLLTTGGVSVGDLDFVKESLDALGVERLFWGVAQKPGRPLTFGRAPAGTLVFGLPGNPVSALVCFYLYVRPALRRLQGHRRLHLPVVQATLTSPVSKARALTEFVRVRLTEGPDGLGAVPLPSQSSGVLTSLSDGAGLLVGPAETSELEAGRRYPVIVVADTTLARERPPF